MRARTQASHAVVTYEDTQYRLEPGGALSFGRHRKNDVVVDSASVSRFHASILWLERQRTPKIVDHGSQNGTIMEGEEIRRRRAVPIRGRVLILLGSRIVRVRLEVGSSSLLEDAAEIVALYTEHGTEVSGTLDSAVDLARVLRTLEAKGRTGTLHVRPLDGMPSRITLCTGRIMAAQKGSARRTRALELLLNAKGKSRYEFTPDLEPTDAPMNLWFSDFLRK